jgi:hypothetical protein
MPSPIAATMASERETFFMITTFLVSIRVCPKGRGEL